MKTPRAWVMGNLDLVRPLARTGTKCVAVARPGSPAGFSRYVTDFLAWPDDVADEEMAQRLAWKASFEDEMPTLFFGSDRALLLVSRHRETLGRAFRFALATPTQIESLTDKARFLDLAHDLDLPVPASEVFRPQLTARLPDLTYPALLKPQTRDIGRWVELFHRAKGVLVEDRSALLDVWTHLVAADQDVVAQHHIPGPESRIESHHVYVPDDPARATLSFTGRKIRTWPVRYGNSSALEITTARDIHELGMDIVARLGLRGVAKLDFKRDPSGRPWLLEVNPRFSLWHHLGMQAGVNVPAAVHADLTGATRPPIRSPRPGTTWMHPNDLRAARLDENVSAIEWLRFARRCDCWSNVSWDDPTPLARSLLWQGGQVVRRLTSPGGRGPVGASVTAADTLEQQAPITSGGRPPGGR